MADRQQWRVILTFQTTVSQSYLFTPAMHQRMTVGMKQHTISQDIRPAVYTPDDVMVVPTGFPIDRMPTKGTKPLLPAKDTEYLSPITQLLLHPLDPQRLPLQLLRRVVRLILAR